MFENNHLGSGSVGFYTHFNQRMYSTQAQSLNETNDAILTYRGLKTERHSPPSLRFFVILNFLMLMAMDIHSAAIYDVGSDDFSQSPLYISDLIESATLPQVQPESPMPLYEQKEVEVDKIIDTAPAAADPDTDTV